MAIIPEKNPKSLIAYYLGFGALLPLIGFFFAIPALILGFQAIAAANRDPSIEGKGHAIVGIVLAIGGLVLWGGCGIVIALGAVAS